MGRRLDGWRALDWRQRRRLAACVLGLAGMHAALALFGYERTRRMVERGSQHPQPRAATEAEIADARDLARLAAIASRHGAVEATCLRRSLLLHGWLRRRGLRPALQLGVKEREGSFQAHAWIELEGQRLLPSDEGYKPFGRVDDTAQEAVR
ncbi:MAG: lasso peptide biosynthesis B2 protein [Burkholderiaceae bacterium]|nr:lasso peptide biosynthesis B2 protein [Burkholderiaceae bacterium]